MKDASSLEITIKGPSRIVVAAMVKKIVEATTCTDSVRVEHVHGKETACRGPYPADVVIRVLEVGG